MNTLLFSINAIVPMLLTTGLGCFISLRGLINENDISFLNRLCFRYLLPIHVFISTMKMNLYDDFNPSAMFYCIACIFATMAVAWGVFSLIIENREKRCIFIVSSFRSNNIIYAMPLAINMFGEAGAKAAAILMPVTIIIFNFLTVVVMVYHSQKRDSMFNTLKRTTRDVVTNPLIIGSVLGILISLANITLPAFLEKFLAPLAASATPMSLILLGSQIDFEKLTGNIKPALGACILRLVIVPAILVPIIVIAGFRGPVLGALMIAFASPCAVTNFVMARNYNIASSFAAQTVYLSTLLSMGSLFVIITMSRALGLF